ncbi:aminotransferase [Microbacterium saperdae]|uniref:Hydroxylysine kinase /5-phosphonooxy-L-lysine phospho-lyase n=1 Tax=Microbacterium saperdae TaxID=69368 RepID=A0A543BPU7_9MICO|nr:aminotransferase [Microbacterium saperdae]TQL86832.1 hydroxylysine kinase /5-phosphonooxy-L-lysine phospho-lyase [Microbacterium saperdae]GGM45085.1 4-aminobutyrate aminotransferase [Microbacterium saperdae]
MTDGEGLVRPDVDEAGAETIARECYGLIATASELGSNQDRNFLLTASDGTRSVLRIDNPVFGDDARDAQHAALDAYRAAGVAVPAVLPGLDGALTQRWGGFGARRSEFAEGEPLVDAGYLAPIVLAEFGALAAASVNALAALTHPGLDRAQMWDMRVAHAQTVALAPAIADVGLRARVLAAAEEARGALAAVEAELPVQPIHGDLTDDNVMGRRGADSRLHPHAVLDLGDLGLGWRVAELSVCASSMLHHEAERPLRVLDTVAAFHAQAPLSVPEARAVWPLVVLRASLLVASGWRQLEIDGANDYARERIAGEQAIFDAATLLPLAEMTEHVLARIGFDAPTFVAGRDESVSLAPLLPDLDGDVVAVDLDVESAALDEGRWLAPDAETDLIATHLDYGATVVVPYGLFRLTRAAIDSADAAATWPLDTEIHVVAGPRLRITAPLEGELRVQGGVLRLHLRDAWVLEIGGAQAPRKSKTTVRKGDTIGVLAASDEPRTLTVGLRRSDAPPLTSSSSGAVLVAPERVPAWSRFTADPAPLLGLPSFTQQDDAREELERRNRIFAAAQERYYERPPQIQRGWRHHLVDTTGRAYIDMVNNVAGLGHGHPKVAAAANRQLRTLATNSRFLFRELAEYSEALLALMPDDSDLDTVLLVNSGSEAVDLALRLAQAATGRRTVVALREAYHGWTMASDAVTTSAYDNPSALATRPDWVHVADVPNRFRGTYRGEDTADRYLADLADDLEDLQRDDRDVAAFLCESILGNAGGVLLPEGYLAGAYAQVRAAGGLCIADEVQVGFGRMGSSFWGFEQSGVIPDIVTIAKPMGNGFPIGGVITSKRIADSLATQGQFFSSAGGSTLSCAVGLAVLDAMVEDDLQRNALDIGARLADGLRGLATRHPLIGVVHGEGLYLGVELVRDHASMEPAAAEAAAICERLRELGVIVLTTSERSNVLKIKPPLCLSAQSADHVVAMLDRVLAEGW